MDRTEALALLDQDLRDIPEGADFTVGYFEAADAPGIARLFHAVYGDGYPIDNVYIPERLIEEHRRGGMRSAVARIDTGDIVAHEALYRSSAPNPCLLECGLGLTLPAYRSSTAFFRTNLLLMELVGKDGVDGVFGEAVCNHLITQKFQKYSNLMETALEPSLMPARAYEAEQSAGGRVGCLVYSRVDRDRRKTLCIPAAYRDELPFLMDGLGLDRELVVSDTSLTGNGGAIKIERFDFAGVARCTITTPGTNLAARLTELEQNLRHDDYVLIQIFIDLGNPGSAGVVEMLRHNGYSLGGFLPIWFGSDALLMQKHFVDPDFEGLRIYSERGHQLVDIVRDDWTRANGQQERMTR